MTRKPLTDLRNMEGTDSKTKKKSAARFSNGPPRTTTHSPLHSAAPANIEPKRFALIFDPPTIVLEYLDRDAKRMRHRR